ncbi:MAG: hypothetical protein GAK44_00100 [Pseudomonas delhiensis]|nr:MAG: hypothetical protein GAK44_00100 [Pseudomonas delhiensis]
MKHMLSLLLAAALLQGCASHRPTGRECMDNFSTSGGIWMGKTFRSFATLPKNDEKAFESSYKELIRQGFQVKSNDPDNLTLVAEQPVPGGDRKATLTLLIEPLDKKTSRLTLVFSVLSGMYAPESTTQTEFCNFVDAASR